MDFRRANEISCEFKTHAIDDIERNAQWWAVHHSKSQALSWYQSSFQALYSLENFPESHSLADENDSFPYDIRNLLFGLGARKSYRAIFTIQDETVHILAVRRASQDSLSPTDVDVPTEIA